MTFKPIARPRMRRVMPVLGACLAVILLRLATPAAPTAALPPAQTPTALPGAASAPTYTAAVRPGATDDIHALVDDLHRMQPTRTPIVRPTATPAPPPAAAVVAQWFEQPEQPLYFEHAVRYAFEIENRGSDLLVADYRVVARLDDGSDLVSDWDYVPLTAAGGRTAVWGELALADGTRRVKRVAIEFTRSDRDTEVFEAPMTPGGSVAIFRGDRSVTATGVLSNPLDMVLTNIRVVALAYDDAGKLIGSDFALVEFLPPGERAGVEVTLPAAEALAEVRLYAGAVPAERETGLLYRYPVPGDDLRVVASGFAQRGKNLTFAFVLDNQDGEDMDTQYSVTVYDAAGRVIGTHPFGTVDLLFPARRRGVVGELELVSADVRAARSVVHVRRFGRFGRDWVDLQVTGARYTEQAPGAGVVVGEIINPERHAGVAAVEVAAITYDAKGNILGGGRTDLAELPPYSIVAVEVPVISRGAVAWVELYPYFGYFTEIEWYDEAPSRAWAPRVDDG